MSMATAPRESDSVDRIFDLTYERTRLQLRLGDTIRAINDLARICEALRYTSGLGKRQMERVEKALAVADEAEQLLVSIEQKAGA